MFLGLKLFFRARKFDEDEMNVIAKFPPFTGRISAAGQGKAEGPQGPLRRLRVRNVSDAASQVRLGPGAATAYNHNYGLEPILLLSPGQLHTHRTCTYGHGGALGRPHDHRCRFGRVKIFKIFFCIF